ncbi:MAG: hypothetical protein SGARI_001085 [Bacillariaceae sp.]
MNEKEQLIQSLLDAAIDKAEQERSSLEIYGGGATTNDLYRTTTTTTRVIEFVAPHEIPEETSPFALVPSVLFEEEVGGDSRKDACAICDDALSSRPSVALTVCGHIFHLDCIDHHLEQQEASNNNNNLCPQCGKCVRQDPTGRSPSGTMTISSHLPRDLPPGVAPPGGGGEDKRVIKILYEIPDGYQKEYHNKPDERFRGCTKVAYVPDTEEGNRIVERLVYAFRHGLTFQIAPNERNPSEKDVAQYGKVPHRTAALDEKDDKQILYYVALHDVLDQLGVPRPKLEE